jgi:transposase InsO family protein
MKEMQRRSRGLRELCRLLGYTSQAYYQYRKGFEKRTLKEELLIRQVLYHRRLQPRLGARKLLVMLQPFMQAHQINTGRDMFFELLQVNGLLVRKRKRNKPRTTFSDHWFRKYPDLVKGLAPGRPDQIWVSDITYIHLPGKKFAYLSLVTDAYSRKIVGFCLSDGLAADGPVAALQMAVKQRETDAPLIHHSDRGIQYCSQDYVNVLNKNQLSISMTQSGDPRDNAIAERVNGILKQELLKEVYPCLKQARQEVSTAIEVYNKHRPHSSLDMLTPEQAHIKTGEITRRWKNYYRTAAKEVYMDG